jgi:hypothetical protein
VAAADGAIVVEGVQVESVVQDRLRVAGGPCRQKGGGLRTRFALTGTGLETSEIRRRAFPIQIFARSKIPERFAWVRYVPQGDQIRFVKNRPICSPTHLCQNSYMTFTLGK